MSDRTILGTFTRRQLEQMHRNAKAGAKTQAQRLAKGATTALRDLELGLIPSGDLTEPAVKLNHWLTTLGNVDHILGVIAADEEEGSDGT